jgi:hypothetical protein
MVSGVCVCVCVCVCHFDCWPTPQVQRTLEFGTDTASIAAFSTVTALTERLEAERAHYRQQQLVRAATEKALMQQVTSGQAKANPALQKLEVC